MNGKSFMSLNNSSSHSLEGNVYIHTHIFSVSVFLSQTQRERNTHILIQKNKHTPLVFSYFLCECKELIEANAILKKETSLRLLIRFCLIHCCIFLPRFIL